MKMKMHRYIHFLMILLLAGMLMTACSEEDDPLPEDPDTEEPDTEDPDEEDPDEGDSDEEDNFFKLIRVENFQGNTNGDGHANTSVFFYNLEDNAPITNEDYVKTQKWDLAFASTYNSFLSGNNGFGIGNYGSGGTGKGGIYMVYKPFEEVEKIPNDSLFKTGHDVYGVDNFFGSGPGWYLYDFGGGHIVYPYFDRTIIVRTAKGHYAKVKMISIYKDAPEQPTTHWPAPYFTFDYVLVTKGSTHFEIRE